MPDTLPFDYNEIDPSPKADPEKRFIADLESSCKL